MPFLFLMIGLVSLTSVGLSFYVNKPLSFWYFDIHIPRLVSGVLCGIGVAAFMWGLFLGVKSLAKRTL